MSTPWWKAAFAAHPLARAVCGWSGPLIWTGASLTAAGCADMWAESDAADAPPALDTQRQSGWNVGDPQRPLAFPGAQPTDAAGHSDWRDALATLAPRLSPSQPRWQPYYAPALFQSLQAPRNDDLRAAMQPIYTAAMALAAQRGQSLLSVFIENGVCRNDVGLVLDIPGPEAVALAAALAPCFEPVFVFDNWPHPDGVVPAHLTLGATVYFLPWFEKARPSRPAAAAPAFVLDRQRLVGYTDDAGLFDNRYFAGLPSAADLRAAGIRHLLYVTPDEQVVLDADDLNGDLVGLDEAGIDVKMLALSDFSQTPLPGWLDDPDPGCPPVSLLAGSGRFYFGGSPRTHGCFTSWYGWNWHLQVHAGGAHIPARLVPRCKFHPMLRAAPIAVGHGGSGGWHGGIATGHAGFGRSGSMGRAHGGFSS